MILKKNLNKRSEVMKNEKQIENIKEKKAELYLEQRNKKEQIYIAFEEYIHILKETINYEENIHKKYLITEEIKKIKRTQEKYYVEPLLSDCLEEANNNKVKGLK